MWTWLKRVDPEEHMNRWYGVGIQPGLSDVVALVRLWGSRETRHQRSRIEPFSDLAAARVAADHLILEKLQRGYQFVAGYGSTETNTTAFLT
jgi:predicted DNA-binding WGR domain protein